MMTLAPAPARSDAPAEQRPGGRLSGTDATNIAWMTALTLAARCGEWLASQGYRLLRLEVDHRGACVHIAHSPRALRHLDGANVGRICTGGESRLIYAARRFDCSIKWEEVVQ